MTKSRLVFFPLLLLLLFSLGQMTAWGHGKMPPRAPKDDDSKTTLLFVNGLEFFGELNRHGRFLLTEQQLDEIERAGQHYHYALDIQGGHIPERDGRDALYNQRLGDESLLEALKMGHNQLVMDFTGGEKKTLRGAYHKIDPLSGTVLLRVITGAGGPALRVFTYDMDDQKQGENFFTIPIASDAVTYVLLTFKNLPPGKSLHHVAFQEEDEDGPSRWDAVLLDRLPLGRLKVSLQDETGQPTPALLRLTSVETGQVWAPGNAISFEDLMAVPEMLSFGGPSKGFFWATPGPARGWYWLVDEVFDMPLPAGEWIIEGIHGVEYYPLHETLTVTTKTVTGRVLQFKRWVHMAEKGWYSGDDHVHSTLLNDWDAERLMAFARATDTHVVNVLEMGDQKRTWYYQRGFGPEFRVRQGDYVLVPGQEDPRFHMGHAIGLNLRKLARNLDKYILNDWVADEVHRQGGLYGHTHVGEMAFHIERDMTMLVPRGKSDFNSILQNRLGTEFYYEFLNLGYKLNASAGSDVPYGNAVGVVRVYCYLEDGFDPDGWFDALGAGRSFVSNGPMLKFTVDGTMPGESIVLKENRKLKVQVEAWGQPGRFAPATLELVRCGEVVATVTTNDLDQSHLTLETELEGGYGFWLAARVKDGLGAEGHTNPVYVKRKGFRHWNMSLVESLVEKRLQTLKDIENLVEEYRKMDEAGELWELDQYRGLVVDQGPELLERTALVRQIYLDLLETYAKEKELRQ